MFVVVVGVVVVEVMHCCTGFGADVSCPRRQV